MTGYQIDGHWLDFTGTVALEIRSPLFDAESVPGTLAYPSSFQDTPTNRRLLRFPATRARQAGPVPLLEADYYIGGLLWRRGLLRYQGYDSKASEYTYQFEADADALASRIDGVMLAGLSLPTQALNRAAENADYVLAPVRNKAFYTAKNPAWCTVLNYFAGVSANEVVVNAPGTAHTYAVAPMLKVVPLLRAALAEFGYSLSGPWVADAEIQQLVLYSTRALDQAVNDAGPVATFGLATVLPDVRLAELLISLQKLFCLGFVFNPVRRELRIVALRDVVTNPAYQPRRARPAYLDVANDLDGFLLAFTPDGSDELLKTAQLGELRIGGGKEAITPAADTLRMVREPDPLNPARQWLVPAAEQVGQSARPDFEQDAKPAAHLRFLFYRGLQPDSFGQLYPLVSSGTVDYFNQSVGNYALEWAGPKGLYAQWHQPWLDFRAAARGEERAVLLSVGEFMGLDPTAKDMVGGLKFLWERISISAGGTGTLSDATITYHQIAQ